MASTSAPLNPVGLIGVGLIGSALAARLLAIDVRHDLALLQLEQPLQAAPLTLRTNQPVKGETGYSMGKPGGYELGIVAGSFNGMSDNETTPLIVFSGPINAGMSGGPALDREGRVVGVNAAVARQMPGIGFAVPIENAASAVGMPPF